MQQLFRLLIFLNQPYMFRATNSPILRSTFDCIHSFWYNAADSAADRCHRNTDRQQCRCTVPKAVYTFKKCSWGWANLSSETCRAELKRLKNEKVFASCWLFTSFYWWCAVTQTPSPAVTLNTTRFKIKQDRQCTYNVPLRCVRATTVAVEKQ